MFPAFRRVAAAVVLGSAPCVALDLGAQAPAPLSAESLLARAREARIRNDSVIRAYEASALSRVSLGIGFRSTGRERVLGRVDHAYSIAWRRGVGAQVTLTGARERVPSLGVPMNLPVTTVLPYLPGSDVLWTGAVLTTLELPADSLVHPLGRQGDASYRFALGERLSLGLGAGRTIVLRELQVTPRRPDWRLVVGSFWLDEASGQLVRAEYRLAARMTAREVLGDSAYREAFADVPRWLQRLVEPVRGSLDLLVLEYGLIEGVWLPRRQAATFFVEAGGIRVPVSHEERIRYERVERTEASERVVALDSVPSVAGPAARGVPLGGMGTAFDTEREAEPGWQALRALPADSLRARLALARSSRDSTWLRHRLSCLETGRARDRAAVPGVADVIVIEVPCDYAALTRSPTLPGELHTPADSMFQRDGWRELGWREPDRFAGDDPVGLSRQPPLAPQRGAVEFALADGAVRYNRVEGASLGLAYVNPIGGGWTARQEVRYGFGNRRFIGGTTWMRTTGRRSLLVRAQTATAVATDFGQPLSLGASLATLSRGHDDGVYYRTNGVDVTWQTEPRGATRIRGFAERHAAMPVTTQWTLADGSGDRRMGANIVAQEGGWAGVEVGDRRTLGLDPADWRVFTDTRAEVAGGTSGYGRMLAEGTVVTPTWRSLSLAGTWAVGTTVGEPPPQRQFFLGGLQTVRGQFVSTTAPGFSGTAFWFGRHEVAYGTPGYRVTLFYDVGWAGPRGVLLQGTGTLLRGGGVGVTLLDGLFRIDYATGITPIQQTRWDVSMDVRF